MLNRLKKRVKRDLTSVGGGSGGSGGDGSGGRGKDGGAGSGGHASGDSDSNYTASAIASSNGVKVDNTNKSTKGEVMNSIIGNNKVIQENEGVMNDGGESDIDDRTSSESMEDGHWERWIYSDEWIDSREEELGDEETEDDEEEEEEEEGQEYDWHPGNRIGSWGDQSLESWSAEAEGDSYEAKALTSEEQDRQDLEIMLKNIDGFQGDFRFLYK